MQKLSPPLRTNSECSMKADLQPNFTDMRARRLARRQPAFAFRGGWQPCDKIERTPTAGLHSFSQTCPNNAACSVQPQYMPVYTHYGLPSPPSETAENGSNLAGTSGDDAAILFKTE